MKQLRNYINIRKGKSTIKATDKTIKDILNDEISKFGFDTNLNHIDVSEVTNMVNVFSGAGGFVLGHWGQYWFNGDISQWDVSNVKVMHYMFDGCENFNCDISNWNVSNVNSMTSTFESCRKFNQPLNDWDVSNVRYMSFMFNGCKEFNQPLNKWETHNVENMANMFSHCEKFNQDISNWSVDKITKKSQHSNMFSGNKIMMEKFKPKFKI